MMELQEFSHTRINMGDNDDAGGSSELDSSISACGKGSKNKRKYLSESPSDTIDTSTRSLTEFPRYEEKLQVTSNEPGLQETSSDDSKLKVDERGQDDWSDPIVSQLLELLTNNLRETFQSAIKKIVDSGYSEEIAEQLLLRSGLHHGDKDVVSNAVEGALTSWKEKGLETSMGHVFKDLDTLVNFTILEMIISVREVRPSSTVVEAMWSLLICDLNLLHASAVNEDYLGIFSVQESSGESSFSSTPSELKLEAPEKSHPNLNISKPLAIRGQSCHSDNTAISVATQLPNSTNPHAHEVAISGKESLVPLPEPIGKSLSNRRENAQTVSQVAIVEEKSGCPRKGFLSNSKRDMLWQKALHFEKSYKGRMIRGALKAKLNTWGSMVLDRTMKSSSGSSGVVVRSTYSKLYTCAGGYGPLPEGNYNVSSYSTPVPQATDAPGILGAKDTVYALHAVNNKVPASSALQSKPNSKTEDNNASSSEVPDYYAGIPYDESLGKYIPQDEKAETILALATYMNHLRKEIRVWKDWANEKVMQAARRLGKDQEELKMLRQEKEEAQKFRKEKQSMEESTMNRFSEMEYVLSNAKAKIEMARSTCRKLEDENAVLKVAVETAGFKALGASKSLQDSLQKEQETLKKSQEIDMMKASMQEELTALKLRTAGLWHQFKQTEGLKNQLEALRKPEEMEKQKYFKKAESMRRETEQQKAQTKAEEDCMREAAESDSEKYNEEIKMLGNEISELRLVSESSRIAALLGGLDIGYAGSLKGGKSAFASREFQLPKANKRLAVFRDNFGLGSVKPERECVMCLTEEMCVVFFPCAHQVLCGECNDRHEKQGMNECPSCRTPVQERIYVRFADSQQP